VRVAICCAANPKRNERSERDGDLPLHVVWVSFSVRFSDALDGSLAQPNRLHFAERARVCLRIHVGFFDLQRGGNSKRFLVATTFSVGRRDRQREQHVMFILKRAPQRHPTAFSLELRIAERLFLQLAQ